MNFDMSMKILYKKILEQEAVYEALKHGDTHQVQYREYCDKEYGTQDANYRNRARLAYYLLYADVDDEETVLYLFQEELKDRKNNSFQGIGNTIHVLTSTIHVLTSLLHQYNVGGKYEELFDEAENANFDCTCGYDRDYWINNDFGKLDLMDCIFLAQDLEYKDVLGTLVDDWKAGIREWTDTNRNLLVRFNTWLGRE